MLIEDVLKALETTKSAVLAKGIGVGEKKLREALRVAGYEYRNSGDKGWHFVGEGEQPLEKSIQDYVTVRTTTTSRKPKAKSTNEITHKEDVSNALTPHEVSMLRDMIKEWETIIGAVSAVAATSESVVEEANSINELYIRVKQEIQPQEKMRKTLNINKGVGTALDSFAAKHKLDKQDIIELALFDFFEKYGEDYTDLRNGDDKK